MVSFSLPGGLLWISYTPPSYPYNETIVKTSSSFAYYVTFIKTSPVFPYDVTIIKTKLGYAFLHIQPTGRQPALPCYKEEGVHGGE